MIDSICLSIPLSKQDFLHWDLQSKTNKYFRYIKNPPKNQEMRKYYPKLTAYTKWFKQEANIRIEFSVSKLVYGNNLDELEETDFALAVSILQARLREMGVILSKDVIENAVVSSVHFSKNIPLENGYTTNYVISEMNKVNLRKAFDFTRSRYTNDGQSLYAHTASHEFIIYDKVADIQASEKRAIDRDQTLYQKSMFFNVEKSKLPEIVRFEVRLVHKRKMNSVLKALGYSINPSFREVFNLELSRKVVSYYWNEVIKKNSSGVFAVNLSHKDMVQAIFKSRKGIKPKQAVYLIGLFQISKDGIRELRSMVSRMSGERTWYRIAQDIRLAHELITQNNVRDWVKQIDKNLQAYKPYKHFGYPRDKIVV